MATLMTKGLRGLKTLTRGGILLLEIRGLRREMTALRLGVERIAAALESANAKTWPQTTQPNPDLPPVTITHVSQQEQAEYMEIELALTKAAGHPPTEDEILAEFYRRHGEPDDQGEAQSRG